MAFKTIVTRRVDLLYRTVLYCRLLQGRALVPVRAWPESLAGFLKLMEPAARTAARSCHLQLESKLATLVRTHFPHTFHTLPTHFPHTFHTLSIHFSSLQQSCWGVLHGWLRNIVDFESDAVFEVSAVFFLCSKSVLE